MVKDFKKRFFSNEECTAIEKTIEQIEKTTSGEIVVVLLPASDSYLRAKLVGTLLGWVLGSLSALTLNRFDPWGSSLSLLLLLQVLCMGVAFVLFFIPTLARFVVPQTILARNVHREALAQFAALGLHATKNHSGILILLSIFERRVEIIADRGIHKAVSKDYWKQQSDTIAGGFKEKVPAERLLKVLHSIGERLAEHFPPDPGNPNELSNKIRFLG